MGYGLGLNNIAPLDKELNEGKAVISQKAAFTVINVDTDTESEWQGGSEHILVTGFHMIGTGGWRFRFLRWLAMRLYKRPSKRTSVPITASKVIQVPLY